MARLIIIGRWVLAIPGAVLAYFLVFGIVALAWKTFGGSASDTYFWGVALATVAGSLAGAYTAPRRGRKLALICFVAACLLFPSTLTLLSLIEHTFRVNNLRDLLGSAMGASFALRFAPVMRKAKAQSAKPITTA